MLRSDSYSLVGAPDLAPLVDEEGDGCDPQEQHDDYNAQLLRLHDRFLGNAGDACESGLMFD